MQELIINGGHARSIVDGSPWPVRKWGTVTGSWRHGADHLITTNAIVPEGSLFVTVCSICGGRIETLLDLRSVMTDTEEHRRAVEDLTRNMVDAREATGWLDRHRECEHEPVVWRVPGNLQRAMDGAMEFARREIEAGEPVLPLVNILTEEDDTILVPSHDLPGPDEGMEVDGEWVNFRDVEIAGRYATIRDSLRANDRSPVAVIFMSEGRMGTEVVEGEEWKAPNDLKDVVFLSVVTPDFSLVGVGEVEDGALEDFRWAPGGGGRVVNGLLATSISPIPQERREAALRLE